MDIRLQKKAVFLVSDLAETQLEKADEAERSFFGDRFFLKSVVDLTHSKDIDLQEKVGFYLSESCTLICYLLGA